jgi:hypothetical protein
MQRHEYFEQLCSLAIIGDLSEQEMAELASHLRDCRECQNTLKELSEISAEQLPLGAVHRASQAPTHQLREATIQRLIQEGLRITPEAMHGRLSWKQRVRSAVEEFRWMLVGRKAQIGIVASVVLVVCVLGVTIRRERESQREIQTLREQVARKIVPPIQTIQNAPVQTALTQAVPEIVDLNRTLAEANAKMSRLETERSVAQRSFEEARTQLEQLTAQNAHLQESVGSRDNEVASLRDQVEQMRAKLNATDAELTATHYQVTSLTEELKNGQAALDREKELLAAGRDVRDLMGARNLHIIDVHDTDARGEARPFGRIFLTEGKRLIFYAYDLDGAKIKNATFQAWGQRTDANRTAVNLGILYMDDQKQARWSLKVEDASLLKAIDSLFVTVEPQGGAPKPTGKKLMYAYLRNPINHP